MNNAGSPGHSVYTGSLYPDSGYCGFRSSFFRSARRRGGGSCGAPGMFPAPPGAPAGASSPPWMSAPRNSSVIASSPPTRATGRNKRSSRRPVILAAAGVPGLLQSLGAPAVQRLASAACAVRCLANGESGICCGAAGRKGSGREAGDIFGCAKTGVRILGRFH
jgi:hypothetical protein